MSYRNVAGLSFAIVALFGTPRSAEAQCPVGWTLFAGTGNCYSRESVVATWSDHQTGAGLIGAHLVTLESGAENEFVRSTFVAPFGTAWIGFNDIASEGTFVWVNGEPVVFTNWSGGEPNNFGNEDVTQMYTTGFWNDLPVSSQLPAVYELEALATVPEPASLALVGGGLAVLGVVARRRRR